MLCSQQAAAQPAASGSHHSNTGAIVGGVLGGVLGALLLTAAVGLAVWLRHIRPKKRQQAEVGALATLQACHHQDLLGPQSIAPGRLDCRFNLLAHGGPLAFRIYHCSETTEAQAASLHYASE